VKANAEIAKNMSIKPKIKGNLILSRIVLRGSINFAFIKPLPSKTRGLLEGILLRMRLSRPPLLFFDQNLSARCNTYIQLLSIASA
jgi:hypothetical protein